MMCSSLKICSFTHFALHRSEKQNLSRVCWCWVSSMKTDLRKLPRLGAWIFLYFWKSSYGILCMEILWPARDRHKDKAFVKLRLGNSSQS